jgi:hypothetical protein
LAGLLVTFVGLPGSGKTALCDRVVQILRRRGAACDQSDETAFRRLGHKSAWAAREALGHPGYALRSLWAIAATRQRSLVDLVRMLANWFARSFLIRRAARAPGIHVFDEGLFQAVWSIGFTARKENWQFSLPAFSLCASGLTIVVEASLATVARRLADRPGCNSRLEKWLPEEPALLAKADGVMGAIKDVISRLPARHPGLYLLVIDNDREDAFEANAICIADRIQTLYDGCVVTQRQESGIRGQESGVRLTTAGVPAQAR